MAAPGKLAPASAETVPLADFRRRLLSFVQRRIADATEAEDIVQSVLVRAARELQRDRQHGDLVAWLFEITRNAVTDYHRQRARRDRHLDAFAASASEDEVAGGSEQDDAAGLGAFAHCVRPMVAAPPEPYWRAVRPVDLDGASQVALARELGLSQSGAKSRMQRGRTMLRNAFLRCCAIERNSAGFTTNIEPLPGGCASNPEAGGCNDPAAAGGCGPNP
jgi:RNA polymerase sigma-70 factor (ECF subfamily)